LKRLILLNNFLGILDLVAWAEELFVVVGRLVLMGIPA
jgi:hypothetical protein